MEPLQHNAAGAFLSELKARVEEWCAGRSGLVRAPVLLWLAYVGVRHLLDPLYTSLFGPLNLALHEGGHLLFGYLPGEFLPVAGGTLLLLAVYRLGYFIPLPIIDQSVMKTNFENLQKEGSGLGQALKMVELFTASSFGMSRWSW